MDLAAALVNVAATVTRTELWRNFAATMMSVSASGSVVSNAFAIGMKISLFIGLRYLSILFQLFIILTYLWL